MMTLAFDGWFMCRLSTDPDPADEPRGVSGYVRALPGEPDLDRIIRLQLSPDEKTLRRSHTPEVGVNVRRVYINGETRSDHPLMNARFNLLGSPVFKGENGIAAEDGKEPILPFWPEVRTATLAMRRKPADAPEYNRFPWPGLRARALVLSPSIVANATGIYDQRARLNRRERLLKRDYRKDDTPIKRDALRRRITCLQSADAVRAFNAIMLYEVELGGEIQFEHMPEETQLDGIDGKRPWLISFWFGAWDADAMCGFVQGTLRIPMIDLSGCQPGPMESALH